jgi:hypothetical protein
VAAWDLPPDVVTAVVGGAKRSPAYRRLRTELATACPLDVWVEDGLGFAQFELDEDRREAARPGWLVFAVRLQDGALLAAKVLESGAEVATMSVSDLLAG